MGNDGFMTPKAIANRIKSKGLLKLRFYCQICEKACRDENGFKCHCASEAHQRQMLLVADNPDKYVGNYTKEFQQEFVKQLSRAHGTKRVLANQVYQEYIADRNHLHMNATRWNTLTDFVTHLGREGICHVEETEKGWYITWIDNSPKALARQAAIQKKERQEVDDEDRQQRLLKEQIERAQQEAELNEDNDDAQAKEFVRENEEQPIKLNMFKKPTLAQASASDASSTGSGVKTKMTMMGGLKKGGGLAALAKKSAASKPGSNSQSSKSSNPKDAQTGEKRKMTAMEEIIAAEQEQKRRKEMKTNGVSYNSYGRGLNNSREGSRRDRERSPSPSRGQRRYDDDRRIRA